MGGDPAGGRAPGRRRRVCVLGAGKMGAQIALEYALGGHEVVAVARDLERARRRVGQWARSLEDLELAGAEALAEARTRLLFAAAGTPPPTADGPAVDGPAADGLATLPFAPELVIESLPEDRSLKVALLRPLARRHPGAVIASNTSSLSVSALGEAIGAAERTLGTHYLNPPLLMPLVEVIRGRRTAPEVVREIGATLERLGKQPVVVNVEVAGFVWNRLQFALLREAYALVREGVVDAPTIEEVLARGLARRWRATGLFGTVALGGVETFVKAGANIVPTLSAETDLNGLGDVMPPSSPDELERRRNRLLAADLRADREDHDR